MYQQRLTGELSWIAQSRSSLLLTLLHVAYVICKVLERFNTAFINLPLAFNTVFLIYNYLCRIAVWTCFCSQLEVCNSSEVSSKKKKRKCGPRDRHLWLLAPMASCGLCLWLSGKDVQQVPPSGSMGSRTASRLLQVLIVPRCFQFNYSLTARKTYSCDQGCWNQHTQSASFLVYGD